MLSLVLMFFFFISLPPPTLSDKTYVSDLLRPFNKLQLPPPVIGPESLAFDHTGLGPYTGVSDGRVLRWLGSTLGFVDFAVSSQNRAKELCDGSSDPALEPACGRPLGLGFYNATGDLYIADAYFGLVVVGSNGGIATQLATSAEGVPFRFLNALDVDQGTGIVYFTDASARFQRREATAAILSGDRTGRLVQYDPRTREVTVLLSGLGFAAGTAVSKDGTFVLVTEDINSRILRFWLQGPKANTSEVFALLPGSPDNIKRNIKGEFWVTVNIGREERRKQALTSSWYGEAISKLTPQAMPMAVSAGIRLREEGKVLEVSVINDGTIILQSISEVQEYKGSLYIGSLALPYVEVYGDL